MSDRLMRRIVCSVAICSSALVNIAALPVRAGTASAPLAASIMVTAGCQIRGTSALNFPAIVDSGPAQDLLAEGSVSYSCGNIAPTLSANDGKTSTATFLLAQAGATVPFTLCAVVAGGTCSPLLNGNRSEVVVPASGTQTVRGEVQRAARTKFPAGLYNDAVVLTVTF